MLMKIKNITNPKAFFEKLEQCAGSVELVTEEGDRLNLRSKLCQYVVMAGMFSEAKIDEAELLFSNPDDVAVILDYLIRG